MEKNEDLIKIETVKVKDLYTFILEYSAKKRREELDVISHQRAYAHSMNPCAEDGDIGLILASRTGNYVGYLGLMPGIVRIRGKDEGIIWPTTMYIIPEMRGHSISTIMINTAQKMNKPLVITGMGHMSEVVFKHLKFKPLKKAEFREISFRRINILPVRTADNLLESVSRPFRKDRKPGVVGAHMFSRLLKKLIYKIIAGKFRHEFRNNDFEEICLLDDSIRDIVPVMDNSFPRTMEWINWMLRFKWVLGQDHNNLVESNYYFSDIRDSFRYIVFRTNMERGKEDMGFIIFSVSSDKGFTRLKVLDHAFNRRDGKTVAGIIIKHAKDNLADTIEIPHDLVNYFKLGIFNRLLMFYREWPYVFSMSDMSGHIAQDLLSIDTRYYDGDIAFV